ncbi:MAG: winged helix-turn-helix domain-containing protein [Bdellovibrionaceae bacterium]|nr:winged helix-turn-helix domain-containing protein [Pseudobdellovibrionaceae bacterium]
MTQIELLRLHCKLYDFVTAKELVNKIFHELKSTAAGWDQWIEFVPAALRVYSELKSTTQLETLKTMILGIGEDESPQSSIWALKGRVGMENKNLPFAESCFQKALASATKAAETERALYGIGIGHVLKGQSLDAKKIFSQLSLGTEDNETKIASLILLSQTLLSLNDPAQALSTLNQAKALCKVDRNHYLWISSLSAEVEICLLMGQIEKAQASLNLIEGLLPSDYRGASHEKVQKVQTLMTRALTNAGFELVESAGRIILRTPDRQVLDLTTQPILVQLLHILSGQPRKCISKEEICQALWSIPYHPFETDNKIYVTIRRLRVALGDQTEKPKYILKKNDGYMLNPDYQFTSFQYKYFASELESR